MERSFKKEVQALKLGDGETFRGEGYRREAWFRGEAPLVIAGAFRKIGDPPDARPAVAVELTLGQHE